MASARHILFRIFYSTSYSFVFIILLAFICASPADTLYQSWRRRRLLDIGLISGAYVLTGLIALLIYASRIYTNRIVIKEIPKTYMPIDENELPRKRVRELIANIITRSAVIAYQVRPRSRRIELEDTEARDRIAAALKPKHAQNPGTYFEPAWGPIEHRGWSSPAATSLSNLEYAAVVAELMDLVEAKAVSLVPVDPPVLQDLEEQALPYQKVIELLIRPENGGMRQYIHQLMELEVVSDDDVATEFLASYEQARFAPRPLSDVEFKHLMRLFADLLRSMKPVNLDLARIEDPNSEANGGDDDDDDSVCKGKTTERMQRNLEAASRSDLSLTESGRRFGFPPARISEDSVPSQATDESVNGVIGLYPSPLHMVPAVRSRTNTRHSSRSRRQFITVQRPQLHQQHSQTSGVSIRSGRSAKSSGSRSAKSTAYSDAGSVIVRLNDERDDGDALNGGNLPYTIEIPPGNDTPPGR